jgi:hypothetical protein
MNIPPGFAQTNLLFSGDGAPRGAQIVLGVEVASGVTDPIAVAHSIYDAYASTVLTFASSSILLTGCRAKLGPNDTGPDGVYSASTPGGNAGAAEVTPQVALLARKNTASGGRINKGRMFIPGAVEGAVDASGNVSSGTIAAYNTALADFISAVFANANTNNLVILHTSPELEPTVITSITLQSLAATQRRRIRKVGGRRRIV